MTTLVAQTVPKPPCIFCNIVNKVESSNIIYEDDEVCVFPNITPASKLHLLIIPKHHIEDATCLTPNDKDLITKMLTVAHEQLMKNNISLSDARLGYHWPPFLSVGHLHLHVIAPVSEMGLISRLTFKMNSYWFVSSDYVASRIS